VFTVLILESDVESQILLAKGIGGKLEARSRRVLGYGLQFLLYSGQ